MKIRALLSLLIAITLWSLVSCADKESAREGIPPKIELVTLESKYIEFSEYRYYVFVLVTTHEMKDNTRFWVKVPKELFSSYNEGDQVPAVIKETKDGLGTISIPNAKYMHEKYKELVP